jgi:FG-GAP-like repeat
VNLHGYKPSTTRRKFVLASGVAFVFSSVFLCTAVVGGLGCRPDAPTTPTIAHSEPVEDVTPKIERFCGYCHKFPPPDAFPRSAWKMEVERGFQFHDRFGTSKKDVPPIDAAVKYFEDRAPIELPPADIQYASHPYPIRFEPMPLPELAVSEAPAISNVNLVHLFDDKRFDILACNMRHGHILVYQPYLANPTWKVLGKVSNPAHAEVVDLDGDGIKDIIVADLGSFQPTDRTCGKVVWLRGNKDGTFTPHTLLDHVGRVADVQAADFRGTGKLDLIVAAFGWQATGEIILLENHTTDPDHPKFEKQILDYRHGTIHVPVVDLTGTGKPSFLALISQEHETVAAFVNRGDGSFDRKTLYSAPHPAWGSSGIQLVDLNRDGKLDILYTNGDVLDLPYLLKPYHSIQWLENKGNLNFVHHSIAPMYGVHRAVAADFQGEGKMDIAAVSFLPIEGFPERVEKDLDAIIILEQTSPGTFVRHKIASKTCDHVTCVAGDVFGTGRMDLVVGNFNGPHDKNFSPVTIYRNMGRER